DGDLGQQGDERGPPIAIITVVGLFDWLSRGRRMPAGTVTWNVHTQGDLMVAESSRGDHFQAVWHGAHSVRVVPLSRGSHHSGTSGWQVALARAEGDVLLGNPQSDWQSARDLAHEVCRRTDLPLDELTERLFSRVGATRLL